MHGPEADGSKVEPVTHGYLLAIETEIPEMPQDVIVEFLSGLILGSLHGVTRVDLEYIGPIDVYDDGEEEGELNGN